MATVATAFYPASAFATLYFLVVPASTSVLALVVAYRAWRNLTSQPFDAPPTVHGSSVWRFYAVMALDPLIFGLILWILWAPVTAQLEAGGGMFEIESGFLLLNLAGGIFAVASLAVALSQSVIFWRRTRDLLGPFSPRVLALLALPELCAISALVVGILILHFAESLLAGPAVLVGTEIDSWRYAGAAYLVTLPIVTAGFAYASKQELGTPSGFVRARAFAAVAIVPPLLSLLVFIALAFGA